MQASWQEGFNQSVFLKRLFGLAEAGGNIDIDGEGRELVALLSSMVRFSEDLPPGVRSGLLAKATRTAIAKRATTPEQLLQSVRSAAKEYARTPKSKFVMFTSVSVHRANKLPGGHIRDVKVTFLDNMPRRVQVAREELFKRNGAWLPLNREPNMKAVKLEVETRNAEEAAAKCLDAIDVLRGIWNFFKTSSWRITFGGPRKPVNAIFLGPVHTFHDASGALLFEQFWYEPTLLRTTSIVDLSVKDGALLHHGERVRRLLRRHKYGYDIESAFVRYARALDLEDHDLAIQKLWSLLEFLTDTGRDSYDKTIRRAKFLYDDVPFQEQVLEHLRRYRNRSVHGGASSGDVEVEVYQLKRLVETVLKFHLGNRFKFESLPQACGFLDVPSDLGQLEARLTQTRQAISFRKNGKKPRSQ